MGHLDKDLFLLQARESVETHLSFSRFVQDAEGLCGNANPFLSGSDLSIYDKLWFELEIVNASALSDWEEQGKPSNWVAEWETYKPDAVELVESLVALIERPRTEQ